MGKYGQDKSRSNKQCKVCANRGDISQIEHITDCKTGIMKERTYNSKTKEWTEVEKIYNSETKKWEEIIDKTEIMNTGFQMGGPGLSGRFFAWEKMSKEQLKEELRDLDGMLHSNAWDLTSYRNKFNALVHDQVTAQLNAITNDPSVRELLEKARYKIVDAGKF